MADYQRKTFEWGAGVQLNAAVDIIPAEFLSFAKNVRLYQQQGRPVLTARAGQAAINSSAIADLNIHSVTQLNNDLASASQAYAVILGASAALYSDNGAHNAFTSRATGFSGSPLCFVAMRPDQSPEPWVYIADSTKTGKVNVAGTFANWGIAPPTAPPTAEFTPITPTTLQANIIEAFNTSGSTTVGGTAGADSTVARFNTTISRILYDSGTTGMACIAPVAMTGILPGCVAEIGSGGSAERCEVDSVYKDIATTTIASIAYDTGTTGLCTITLTDTPREGLVRNAMMRIAAAENVRVISVTLGPNDVPSFRCSTTATRSAGNAITGLVSFRAYTAINHVAAEAIADNFVRSTVAAGIGTITNASVVPNLSSISGRPVGPDDYIHLSVRCDNLENLVEGRFIIDVGGAATFTENYFYAAFRPNDFVSAVQSTTTQLTAKQLKLQRALIDSQQAVVDISERIARRAATGKPEREGLQERLNLERNEVARISAKFTRAGISPTDVSQSSDETTTGASQWTEFKFKIKDLQRVGSNDFLGLRDAFGVRVSFEVTDNTVCDINECYLAGSYGPDVGTGDIGAPYLYISRFRSSTTGAKSFWSPPIRTGVLPHRQAVTVTPQTSSDGQVDKIDIARYGGSLLEWIIVGTIANSGTYADELPDDTVASLTRAEFNDLQPFAVLDVPRSATVTVVGTSVTRTGGTDTFNTAWAPGTECYVNGVLNRLYSQPSSTTVLQLELSAGSQTSVTLFIPEPVILGATLPAAWGPFGQGALGTFVFACGAVNQAGTLFWTNGNDPDSASDRNQLEVTSPSEQLMNGCVYGSRAFVFSSDQLYEIYPSAGLAASDFITQATPCAVGLFARYGLAVGKYIYFVAKDGIYRTSGGAAECITDRDLYPLFPHDGQAGVTVNGVVAPDFTSVANLRLSYGDETLRFDYLGIDAARYTLTYDEARNAWMPDIYGRPVIAAYFSEGRGQHRWLFGSTNGKAYVHSGVSDDTIAIACEARSPSFDMGDPRATKLFGDLIIDYDPKGATLTAQPGFDSYSTLPSSTALTTTTGRRQQIVDINTGAGTFARNLALDIAWSSSAVAPLLYLWQPAFFAQPESIQRRRTDFTNLGYAGPKFFQGIRITADTANTAKSILVQGDNGTAGLITTEITLSIQHNGQSTIDYPFNPPFIAHNVRLLPNDATSWELFDDGDWLWQPDSPLVTYWETQTITEWQGFGHVRDGFIAHVSTADITLTLVLDGTSYAYTIANGGGAFAKTYVPFQAIKYKAVKYKLSSSVGFRLYKRMCEVRTGQWGRSGPYSATNPFGEFSDNDGARI